MSSVIGRLSKPSFFPIFEFVIIVLGVLVAVAVDSWNEERRNQQIRQHLVGSLLSDLSEDKEDYAEFVADSSKWSDDDYSQAMDAFRRLGNWADRAGLDELSPIIR